MDTERRLLTLAAAAKRYGLSPRTLRVALRRGELEHSRPGRRVVYLTDAAVEAWLRRQQVPPTPTAEARARAILEKMN